MLHVQHPFTDEFHPLESGAQTEKGEFQDDASQSTRSQDVKVGCVRPSLRHKFVCAQKTKIVHVSLWMWASAIINKKRKKHNTQETQRHEQVCQLPPEVPLHARQYHLEPSEVPTSAKQN